jgi:hypothetical protein
VQRYGELLGHPVQLRSTQGSGTLYGHLWAGPVKATVSAGGNRDPRPGGAQGPVPGQ